MWLQTLVKYLNPGTTPMFARRKTRQRATPANNRWPLETLEQRCLLTLNPAVNYPVAASPLDVVVGDFNGDSTPDLAAINAMQLSVLPGIGDGTFRDAHTTSIGYGLRSLAAGHFNTDGRLDLVMTSSVTTPSGSGYVIQGFINVLLNDGLDASGNVTFQPARSFSTGANTVPGAIAVGDLNGDGKLDVAAGQASGTNVTVLLGNGDGNLGAARDFGIGGSDPVSVAVGDIDDDGKLDLVTANRWSNNVGVLLNNGNDAAGNVNFQPARNAPVNSNPQGIAVGDFDGNGRLDLAVTSTYYYYYGGVSGYVNVLLGNGDGTFAAARSTFATNSQLGDVATADFNGDGKLDVVTPDGTFQPARVDPTVLLGRGDGTFDPPYHFDSGFGPVAVTAADLNGDTAPDVSVANSGAGNVSVLLNDQDWPPLGAPFVNVDDAWVSEGNTGTVAAIFTVSLSAPFSQPISVRYMTADATATDGTDYQAASGTLTFTPGGPLSQTVTVLVNGERLAEPYHEHFFVNLSNPSNARIGDGQGIGTITDNEPTIFVDSPQVTEGNSGTIDAVFRITMSGSSDGPVTVIWSTRDGGAVAGSDYQARSGTLTFNPGAPLTQTVRVPVLGDRLGEYYSESFDVVLSNGNWGTGSILDDEPLINISDVTVTEGNTGTTNAVFTVSLSRAYDQPVSVNFSTAEGDTQSWSGCNWYGCYYPPPAAASGIDFQAASGSLTFSAGQTSRTVSVVINGDRVVEPYQEYFSVDLANASSNASMGDSHGLGVITDNEPLASVDTGTTVIEGNTGTRSAVFTVSLAAASDGPVTVNWTTADGTATAGLDYQSAYGTLTFNPGAPLTQSVSVPVIGDRIGEYTEYFSIVLGNGSSGNGAIVDDEPIISISDNRGVSEGNTGTVHAVFTVSLREAYDEPVSVNFSTFEGDTDFPSGYYGSYGYYYYPPPPPATSGFDFQPQSGPVTFAPGETSKEITVVINGDRLPEADEYFSVNLSNASPNAVVSDGHGVGVITDDEPRISISDATVSEGNAGTTTAVFTVSLFVAYDEPVSANFATASGDTQWWYGGRPAATTGSDFQSSSGPVTIPAGQTSTTISVVVQGDTLIEEDEYFSVDLTSPSFHAAIYDGHAVGLIADDDQPPTKFYVIDPSSDKTFEYDAAGQGVENYGLASGNNDPRGAASDASGQRVWVIDNDDFVYVYDSDGNSLGAWKANGLSTPEGIASDGNNIWIVDRKSDRVFRYTGGANRTSGSANATSSFALASGNKDARGIETDGTHFWVVNDASTDKVFKYTLSGALVGSWTISGTNTSPTGITLDPSNPSDVWIVDAGRDQVFQYTAAASRISGSQSPSAVFSLAAGNTNPQGIADPPPSLAASNNTLPVVSKTGVRRAGVLAPPREVTDSPTGSLRSEGSVVKVSRAAVRNGPATRGTRSEVVADGQHTENSDNLNRRDAYELLAEALSDILYDDIC